tara:strand:- start:5425 stop:6201 length:777 start_codon:yes stop_codon:yes gene_type:complete
MQLDKIYVKSCERMEELDDESVDLVVTSPPYENLKDYATWLTYADYMVFINYVFRECYRVMKPGAWICWNIQECIPRPFSQSGQERRCDPLLAHTISKMEGQGFLYEKDIVWYKGKGTATQKLFGSYPLPSLILISGLTEHIITARKPRGKYKRNIPDDIKEKSKLTKEEWGKWAVDLWDIPPVPAKSLTHPAPFPLEIPKRLIRLNSFVGDVVLDPFMGSGQTAIAARQCSRHYVGYEIHEQYAKNARDRIGLELFV